MSNNSMIEIKNIYKVYKSKNSEVKALDDISAKLPERGFVFVNGISGSGKTTLMNILAGIDKPSSGTVKFLDENISDSSDKKLSKYRNTECGIVFQSFNLIDDMTVGQNILLPLEIQSIDNAELHSRVEKILDYVGLSNFENRKCSELSAGQKQRVAIARAIVKRPRVILADEATGNLDPKNAEMILELFNNISKECLVVLISHDNQAARRYGDRIITLSEGKIISDIDNRKIKNLTEKKYCLNIETEKEKKIIPLEEFDLKDEIVNCAHWNGNFFEDLKMNLHLQYRDKIEIEQEKIKKEVSAKIKKLPVKEVVYNALFLIKKNKVKTFLTVCLISFICCLFMLSNIVTTNDYNTAIINYIEQNEYDFVSVEEHFETEEYDNVVNEGKKFLTTLNSLTESNTIKCSTSHEIMFAGRDETESIDLLYTDKLEMFEDKIVDGCLPVKDNQVVLAENIANTQGVKIGDEVVIEGIKCEICGTCTLKLSDTRNYAIVSSNIITDYIKSMTPITLQGVNVTLAADKTEYAYGIASIGSVAQLKDTKCLVWGRMPEKKNELIISSELAKEIGYNEKGDFIKKYRLPDLFDEKYNGEYDKFVNLYDFLGKKVEIVGVYDSTKADYGEILISDKEFNSLQDYVIEFASFDECMIPVNKDLADYIYSLSDNGYEITDDICASVYAIKSATDKAKNVMIIITLVLFVMLSFVLIYSLAYNVKDNTRRVGVLRILGVKNRDIEKIYFLNSFIISSISIALSFAMSLILVRMFNYEMFAFVQTSAMDILYIDWGHMVLQIVMIIVLAMIVTDIPLRLMFRKSTINLINE